MLRRDEMQKHIKRVFNIEATKPDNKKIIEYKLVERKVNSTVYFTNEEQIERIIIHPDWESSLESQSIGGISFQNDKHTLMNANFSDFPSLNGGSEYGCAITVKDIAALNALLVRIGALPAPEPVETTAFADMEAAAPQPESLPKTEREAANAIQAFNPEKPTAFDDVDTAAPQLANLPKTEREAVIAARIGQGRFRAALMSAWSSRCAVTGTKIHDLLRASHIKPWRDSDNEERLDAENGLLLVATLDAAFDAGLISFENDGTVLFSPRLDPDPCGTLRIPVGSALTRPPSPGQQIFLAYHRQAVFR